MKKRIIHISIAFIATFIFTLNACKKDKGPIVITNDNDSTKVTLISFNDSILPIFNSKCFFCHPPSGGMDLSNANAYANTVNVVSGDYAPAIRVVPFDTAASIMWNKITNTGVYGAVMPPSQNLTAAEIDAIGRWILQGALNN